MGVDFRKTITIHMDTRYPEVYEGIFELQDIIEKHLIELYNKTHNGQYDEIYLESESYGYAGEGYSKYNYDFKQKDWIYKEPDEKSEEDLYYETISENEEVK